MQTIILQIPDSLDATEAQAVLVEAVGFMLHEAEAEARQAEVHNLGWGVESSEVEVDISSKTSRGVLRTHYHAETGNVVHMWADEITE